MTKSLAQKLLLGFSPLLIMLPIAAFLQQSDMADSVLRIQLGLDTVSLALGVLGTVLLLGAILLKHRTARRLEEQVALAKEQSRVEHRQFIQRLDHELKNPLTTIRLGIENIRSQQPQAPTLAEIDNIEFQSQRLITLTGDLRKIGIFDSQGLDLAEVNVGELVHDLEEMGKEAGLFTNRQVQFILPSAPWPVPNIVADRDLLQLALYNLIDNAVKYSNPGDTVEIRATEDGSNVQIEVSDTGLGIMQGETEHVWEELFRGKNARHQPGSGIGLSLVKRIIDRHQGTIAVDSKENTGTRISILLPIAPATPL